MTNDCSSRLNEAGNMPINRLVADLSHHVWDDHGDLDFAAAKTAGIIGVVFKATEGATYQDATYGKSRTRANQAGLLWGAFHYGTAANVEDQVKNFQKTAAWDDDTLLGLDFEYNERRPSNTMSKDQAIDFLDRCEQLARRPLTVYTGMNSMTRACGNAVVPELGKRRLWWAEYNDTVKLHPTWKNYWLWQYTDGKNGDLLPHDVAGFGNCDLNSFAGTAEQLRASWVR